MARRIEEDQIPLKLRRWTEYQISERDEHGDCVDSDFADTLKKAREVMARVVDWHRADPNTKIVTVEIEKRKCSAMENDQYEISEDLVVEYTTIETITVKETNNG